MNENLHDREIRIDNDWTVKIGRGLDFFQRPDNWFSVGANDLGLRKCLETKVDIYKRSLEVRSGSIFPKKEETADFKERFSSTKFCLVQSY